MYSLNSLWDPVECNQFWSDAQHSNSSDIEYIFKNNMHNGTGIFLGDGKGMSMFRIKYMDGRLCGSVMDKIIA